MRAQPRGSRGTPDRPYSALNLRLALAAFGLVMSVLLAVLLFQGDNLLLAWAAVLLAVVAAVDLVVVQLRRRARRRDGRSDGRAGRPSRS